MFIFAIIYAHICFIYDQIYFLYERIWTHGPSINVVIKAGDRGNLLKCDVDVIRDVVGGR